MALEKKLLIILDPTEALNPRASELKLNEVAVMMDKNWTLHVISSQKTQYENLSCNYQVHKARMLSSSDSILSRLLYLTFSVYLGVRLVREHKIPIILAKEGHLVHGLLCLTIKNLTGAKCIIRVNENSVLELLLFIKRIRTPLLSGMTFLRIVETISGKMETYVFKHADWIMTQGPMDVQRIKKVTNNVSFVPLWVDAQKFRPLTRNEKDELKTTLIKVDSKTKVFLFVGRLHLEKDLDTLLHAFRKLLDTRSDVMLAIIGTGPEEERCKKLVTRLAIMNRVKFLDYIPHDELPKYYNAADVYVLSSIWEEWSNTVMEAMACGLPVIATDVGGNSYLVRNKITGFLVPPKKPSVISDKMNYVLDHPEESARISIQARLEVEKYSKESTGEIYKTVITQVIGRS
jgi:glycosyltransferase involved in cell wall biosynthesis